MLDLKRIVSAAPITSSLHLQGEAQTRFEELENACDVCWVGLFDPYERGDCTGEEWAVYATKVRRAAQYLISLAAAVDAEVERLKDTPPPSGVMSMRDGRVKKFSDKMLVTGTFDGRLVEIELLGTTKIEAW